MIASRKKTKDILTQRVAAVERLWPPFLYAEKRNGRVDVHPKGGISQ